MKRILILLVIIANTISANTQFNTDIGDGYAYGTMANFIESITLNAPQLIAPTNNAVNQVTDPSLQWRSGNGATSYNLQVSTVLNFATKLVNQTAITATNSQANRLNYNTQYL